MRSFKIGMLATAVVCAFAMTAQAADCRKVTASGETLTHDTAVLFSTSALKNILAAQGLIGKGPVRTTCKTGSGLTTCYSSQVACKGATPKTCLGPWLCL